MIIIALNSKEIQEILRFSHSPVITLSFSTPESIIDSGVEKNLTSTWPFGNGSCPGFSVLHF